MAPNSLPTTFIILISCTLIPGITYSLPFVLFHGIADDCSGENATYFTKSLSNWSGSQGYCIEIGNGEGDSYFMPLLKQTEIACEKVKNMSELSEGYNIVGLSQGNMVARGVIEFCDGGPQVKNYISLAGPHAGSAARLSCSTIFAGPLCEVLKTILKFGVYTDFAQEHLAPASYTKFPNEIDKYKKGCKFLPRLSNEIDKNSTYKERFASLQNLVLIKFDQEQILTPKETAWFGYYPNGSMDKLLPVQETKLYREDWIGLKALDEAGKVKFINVTGGHLQITDNDMRRYIVPYLQEETSKKQSSIIIESSRFQPSAS